MRFLKRLFQNRREAETPALQARGVKTAAASHRKEDQAILEKFVNAAIFHLLKRLETEWPGPSKPVFICFLIPGTENRAFLEVSQLSPRTADTYHMETFVLREETDRACSHFWKSGSIEDIRAFLSEAETPVRFADSLRELSKSVDDFWD